MRFGKNSNRNVIMTYLIQAGILFATSAMFTVRYYKDCTKFFKQFDHHAKTRNTYIEKMATVKALFPNVNIIAIAYKW